MRAAEADRGEVLERFEDRGWEARVSVPVDRLREAIEKTAYETLIGSGHILLFDFKAEVEARRWTA